MAGEIPRDNPGGIDMRWADLGQVSTSKVSIVNVREWRDEPFAF